MSSSRRLRRAGSSPVDKDGETQQEFSSSRSYQASDVDLGHPVFPDDAIDHHACPIWGLFAVVLGVDGDWWPELVTGGMTLAQADELAKDMGAVLIGR